MSLIETLLTWLQSHPGWTLAAIFIVALAESLAIVGLLVPGVVLLIGISVLAGSGTVEAAPLLLAGMIGAILGDGISFWIGHHFHQHLREFGPFRRHPEWIDNGEAFFYRHGGKSIVLGRFVGPIRPFIPMVAGMLDMPVGRFILTNLFSALLWAPVYLLPGYLLGSSLQQSEAQIADAMQLGIVLLLVGSVALYGLRFGYLALSPGHLFYRFCQRQLTSTRIGALLWRWRASGGRADGVFPLASLALALALLLAMLFALQGVLFNGHDRAVADFFSSLRHPAITLLLLPLKLLAERPHLAGQAGLLAIWLLARRGWHALGFWFALLLLTLQLANRQLPLATLTAPLGFAAYLIAQSWTPPHRFVIYTGMAALISLFGISQLYFEAPPFTTVIKELLVGLLIANLMTLFCHRHHEELALRGTLPGWSWSSASLMISVVYLLQHWSHASARMVGSGWL